MARSTLRLAVVASAALVLLGWLLFAVIDPGEFGESSDAPLDMVQSRAHVDALGGAERAADPRDPERSVLAEKSQDGRWYRIRLLDATLGEPLVGSVWSAQGARLCETGRDGRARVQLEQAAPPALEFRAAGYVPRKLAPLAADLEHEWLVRLEPERVTTIETVTQDGTPVAGVEVRIAAQAHLEANRPFPRFRSLPPPPDLTWLEGTTDASGRLSFPLAVRAVAQLHPPGGSLVEVQLVPGETARVTVALETATLLFVDAQSGAALPGFVVETRDALDPRHRPLRQETDAQGELRVPTGRREFVVVLKDVSRKDATCAADVRVTRLNDGYAFRFSEILAGETFEIQVERCSVGLRLVDALSGEPLVGRVEVRFERAYEDPELGPIWSASKILRSEHDLASGGFSVGCTYIGTSPLRRLRLTVAGYAPAFIQHAALVENGTTTTVPLQPDNRTVRVQVIYADGSPFLGSLSVRDDGTGSITSRLPSNSEGRLEPITWSGGDLTVFCFSHEPPGQLRALAPNRDGHLHGGLRRHLLGHIAANDAGGGAATLTLEYSPLYGMLTVHGAPQDAPILMARDVDGILHRATRVAETQVVFERLPAGEYTVGTQAWLELLRTQGLDTESYAAQSLLTRVEVGRPGELDWDPRWRLEAPLEGRVRCDPSMLSELALRPWYATRSGNVRASDDVRIYLDAEGRYRIPAGEPQPEVLLVCTANSSYWIQVLQAFEPGQDTELALGRMTLEWDGPPPPGESVTVLYWPQEPVFDTEFLDLDPNGYYLEWNTRRPLALSAVSTFVKDVRIAVGRDPRVAFPVAIRAGEETRLSVRRGGGRPVPVGR